MQQQRGPTHTHAHCRPTKPPPSSSETRCRPDDDETICHFRSPNGHAVTSGFDFQHAVSWWCFAVTIALKCTYRHQPPHRTVLGQVDCFVQCEVVGSQIALDGVQPRDTRTPGGLFQLSDGEPTESSRHPRHHPYVQYAQIWKDAVTGLSLRGQVA